MSKIIVTLFLVGVSILTLQASSTGGLVWLIPSTYFENVDEIGMVCLNDRLLWIKTTNIKIPFYSIFSTKYNGTSDILGKHWRIPLFESKAYPRDKKSYIVHMPDGRILAFVKTQKSNNLFYYKDVWTASITKELFIVKSIYGIELHYKNGRLYRMKSPKNYGGYDMFFKYQKGKFIELKSRSTIIAKCEYKGNEEIVIDFPNMKQSLEIIKQEKNKDENTIEHTIELVSSGEVTRKYKILFSEKEANSIRIYNSKNNENFKLITWDQRTGHIKSDDNFSYIITPPTGRGWYAKIERENKNGQKESWYRDNWNGIETILRVDGVNIERSWFTTGRLRKLDKYIKITSEQHTTKTEFFYNENRQLIRENKDGIESNFIYEPDGKLGAIVKNGKLAWSTPYGAILAQPHINTKHFDNNKQ